MVAPLTKLARKGSRIKYWNENRNETFERLKQTLDKYPILVAPDWNKLFHCHTDASQIALGGTLTQLDQNGAERVVAYVSKKLRLAEETHTENNRELLALVYVLRRLRGYIEGSEFDVIPDKQALKHLAT